MTTSILLREYILLRARAVQYAALLLVLGVGVLLVFLATASAANLNRTGLLLQLLGVLAALPEVAGRENTAGARTLLRRIPQRVVVESDHPFELYLSHNQALLIGNTLTSLVLAWLLVNQALFPSPDRAGWEVNGRILLGMAGFLWLDLLMLAFIYKLLPAQIPAGLVRAFYIVDFFVSFFGIALAAAAYFVTYWMTGLLRFVYPANSTNLRRVLLAFSLPFFMFGVLLEIVATWL